MLPTPLQLPEDVDQVVVSPEGEFGGDGPLESLGGGNADGGLSPRHTPNSVVSAIQALPLDVGTAISPTLSAQLAASGSRCRGGPGNAKCGLVVKDEQNGIQCDLCMAWFHAQCQGMSKSAYNALNRHTTTFSFVYDGCKCSPPLEKLLLKTSTDVAVQTELFADSVTIIKPVSSMMGVDSSVQTSSSLLESLGALILQIKLVKKKKFYKNCESLPRAKVPSRAPKRSRPGLPLPGQMLSPSPH